MGDGGFSPLPPYTPPSVEIQLNNTIDGKQVNLPLTDAKDNKSSDDLPSVTDKDMEEMLPTQEFIEALSSSVVQEFMRTPEFRDLMVTIQDLKTLRNEANTLKAMLDEYKKQIRRDTAELRDMLNRRAY